MIDYKLLSESIEHYENRGYVRIEAPWTVSAAVDDITKPADRPHYQLKHNDKCLVASGEQSFLYLYVKDYLPKGKFQTVTPCFRYEPYDEFHEKCFMKNELIITDSVNEDALNVVIEDAFGFFKSKFKNAANLKVVKTDIGYDIEYHGVEVGSYGIRNHAYLSWIYGTGCAEPRVSKLIQQYDL